MTKKDLKNAVQEDVVVLLVDDDPTVLEGVADLLHYYGYTVLTATDGMQALDMMRQRVPDLVVSDIMMPEMDGYEFFEEVRGNPEWTPIPFIFLTARGQQVDVRRGHRLGADDYLIKPFEPEDLLIAVQARLKRVRDIQSVTQVEVERMKQQLLTIFGHELRTPLTYIYGYVNLLKDELSGGDDQMIDDMLNGVHLGAERLKKLVDDLVFLARLDSGLVAVEIRHRSEPSDIVAIVNSVVKELAKLAEERNVEITVRSPPELEIRCLPGHVKDAISRLVDNAIKFSKREGGHVWIDVTTQGELAHIIVRDDGIGIEPVAQARAFERFEQIDRELTEQQGVGRGLTIARSLVELHGGSIRLDSEPGEGSTFYVALPLAGPAWEEEEE